MKKNRNRADGKRTLRYRQQVPAEDAVNVPSDNEIVDYLPERLESLKSETARTYRNFLQTAFHTISVFADLAETEQRVGDLDGARQVLQHAERDSATADRFMSSPMHKLTADDRGEFSRIADSLRTRLDGLRRSMV